MVKVGKLGMLQAEGHGSARGIKKMTKTLAVAKRGAKVRPS